MIYLDPSIMLIAVFVSAACAIPGVFLVLRRMALMSDAISHAVLPGIVLGFLLGGHSLASPLLLIGAVVMGIVTVLLTEGLVKTRLLANDTAIGIVFPALFSIGVILIGLLASNAHIDTDAVFQGDLVFSSLNSLKINGKNMGPVSAWIMGGVFFLNLTLILVFFKELKLSTFDPELAAALGFFPVLINYGLMIDVSITAVGAFDAVGSILVVALMIAPAAAAYLITDKLWLILVLSVGISVAASLAGYVLAAALDVNISGSMAGMNGVAFFLAFMLAPDRGMVSIWRRRKQQKLDFAICMLSVHLLHHRNNSNASTECCPVHLHEHINWEPKFARTVIEQAKQKELMYEKQHILELSPRGEALAVDAMKV